MSKKVAIVTGGAGDVGTGVCRALTKDGMTVVALDLKPSQPGSVELDITCDVTDPGACATAVAEVVDRFGAVDTVVNMAQYFHPSTPLLEMTPDQMRLSFESGPYATLRMMQLCYPHLKAQGGGAIVNFASGAGTYGLAGLGGYAAAKEAIRGLTKVAAVEWGRDNIRVNAICPMSTSNTERPEIQAGAARSPMGRVGDPETDIGSVVVFLAGPGVFITGRTLQVDGGAGSWR